MTFERINQNLLIQNMHDIQYVCYNQCGKYKGFFFFLRIKWKIQSKCDTKHAMHYILFYCTKLMQIRNNFRWHLFIIELAKYTLCLIVYKIKKS